MWTCRASRSGFANPCRLVRPSERRSSPNRKRLARPAEIIQSAGVNTAEHLEQAIRPERIKTFQQRVEWCRRNHKAWTDGKPGPVATMEGHLAKHILPRFGELPVDAIDETTVQEFVADLKRSTFERRKPNGALIKTYRLSRKTVLNIVGVVKLVLGRKVWMTWELDLGKTESAEATVLHAGAAEADHRSGAGPATGSSSRCSPARACGSARRRDCTSMTSTSTTA